MRMPRFFGAVGALAALALVAACHKSDTTAPSVIGSTDSYVSGVTVAGVAGTFTAGTVPAASGGPAVPVTGNSHVVNGGTDLLGVTASPAAAKLYVSVVGLNGYYDVPVPAPGTSATVLLAIAQAPPASSFQLAVQGVSSAGLVGAATNSTVTVTTVGTGDVQVSLSWDVNSDLDLHVVEPLGEEIYWDNRVSGTGGKLDLDSNASCNLDGIRNENVTWATGTAPRGAYTVRIDQWSSCTQTSTQWVLRVNLGGNATTYTGTLTGAGDQGGRGSGAIVATFSR